MLRDPNHWPELPRNPMQIAPILDESTQIACPGGEFRTGLHDCGQIQCRALLPHFGNPLFQLAINPILGLGIGHHGRRFLFFRGITNYRIKLICN